MTVSVDLSSTDQKMLGFREESKTSFGSWKCAK